MTAQLLRIQAWIACAAILAAAPASALDPAVHPSLYGHQAWTSDQGLPESTIYSVALARDGYLWLSTQEGLVRFDGHRFAVFDKRNVPVMTDSNINCVLADSSGTLWVGTFAGGLLRKKDDVFTVFGVKEGLPDRSVIALSEGRNGRIWVTTPRGVAFVESGRLEPLRIPTELFRSFAREDSQGSLWLATKTGLLVRRAGAWQRITTREGLLHDRIDSWLEDRQGVIWVGTAGGGLHRFVGGRLAEKIRVPTPSGIGAIFEDREGSLWIGSDGGGLFRYRDRKFEAVLTDVLVGNHIWSIREDREGSLWVGATGGLGRLRDLNIHSYTRRHGLPHDNVWAALEDDKGNLWLATAGGLHRLGLAGVPGKTLTQKDGLTHNTLTSLLQDRRGALWIGSAAGLNVLDGDAVRKVEDAAVRNRVIRCLHEDTRGDLWLGTDGDGLIQLRAGKVVRVYTKTDGLLSNRIYAIAGDGEGGLWVGSLQGGLNRLRSGRVEPAPGALAGTDVMALYREPTGALWIGTYGSGLFRLHAGQVTRYTTSMGLYDDRAFQIHEDGQGRLWMSSNRGVYRVDRAELEAVARGERDRIRTSVAYGKEDGLKSPECNGGGFLARDGRLWIPTVKGVSVLDPKRWKKNELPPPVIIERVLVDSAALDPAKPADLPAGSRKLEFHAAGLSFLVPERVRYRFKLEGFDRDFVDTGSRRVAYYTSLSPGSYRLIAQAANNDGVWNTTGASFSFRLRPHFYQTTWFYGLCGVLTISAAFGGHRLRIRQLRARERYLERVVAERTQELAEANAKLWAEMGLAKQIQLAILPPEVEIQDLDVFGMMVPADEVGGDYFDVQRDIEGRPWFLIGDVSGHGVTSGLIMMMAQTAVATALQRAPAMKPDELLGVINEPLRDNIERLKESKFLTLTALAYEGEGQFVYAGLHQDLLVFRAAEGNVDALETQGAWVAMMPDLGSMLETQVFRLAAGDVLVLYTDGVLEATSAEGVEYGSERLVDTIRSLASQGLPARTIAESVVADVLRHAPKHDDDVSVLVIRRRPAG